MLLIIFYSLYLFRDSGYGVDKFLYTFVYPFGAISDASLPILKELGFQATLTCEEKINYITKDADCLYGLGRYLRPAGMSSEEYFKNILREKQ